MMLAHVFAMFFFFPAFGLIGLALTAFWIWMLVDCGRRVADGDRSKLGWLVAIALSHFLGALAYFIFGRPTRFD